MKIEPTLLGVIIGSGLSLVGNFLTQWATIWKEERQWKRQQAAEEKKMHRLETKEKIRSIKNIYQNCISRLSLLVAIGEKQLEISNEELMKIHQEAVEWLALLSLHHRDLNSDNMPNLSREIHDFCEDASGEARFLLPQINKFAMEDKFLFPGAEIKKSDPKVRRVQMNIDETFRRQQAIEGIELGQSHVFECNISILSNSQREKLWDMHYESRKSIPPIIHLSVPKFDERLKIIALKGPGIWTGKLNPHITPPEEIFNAWEKDYNDALTLANKNLQAYS
jgi:hypothetical protein